MAAPSSDVDICNLALDYCGQAPDIQSISPPSSPIEALMSRHYDACRQEVLRMDAWTFATTQAMIPRIGTPLADYNDQYQFPSDYIRLLSVSTQPPNSLAPQISSLSNQLWQTMEYRILGNTLCINNPQSGTPPGTPGQPTILIRYIRDETDINIWHSAVKKVLAFILALDVGYQITKQEDVIARLNKQLAAILPEAMAVAGQENPPKRIEYSRNISKRRFQLGSSNVASPYTIIP
jgi:hypothetical protein